MNLNTNKVMNKEHRIVEVNTQCHINIDFCTAITAETDYDGDTWYLIIYWFAGDRKDRIRESFTDVEERDAKYRAVIKLWKNNE